MVQRPSAADHAQDNGGGSNNGQREPSSSRMGLTIGYPTYQNAGYNKLFTQVSQDILFFSRSNYVILFNMCTLCTLIYVKEINVI